MEEVTKSIKHVFFFTPYWTKKRGNATTAKRITTGLKEKGIYVHVFAYDEETWTTAHARKLQQCDLVHILHFSRFLRWNKTVKLVIEQPLIVTSGGTDVNAHLDVKHTETIAFLQQADAVTVFTEDAKQKLEAYSKRKVSVIPQSVWLPHERQKRVGQEGDPHVLLPAGLRQVKDVFFALSSLKKLHNLYPSLMFTIIGEPLEADIVDKVKEIEATNPWVTYKKPVPLEEMAALYEQATIVLNTSISEGQTSVLLEAMYVGVPVIARKIPGNKSIVTHHQNGWLFQTEEELYHCMLEALRKPGLYKKMQVAGSEYIKKNHALEQEIFAYMTIYKQAER